MTVSFSPDGRWLVTRGTHDIVTLWPVIQEAACDGAVMLQDGGAMAACVRFSPKGRWLFAGHMDHIGRLWPLADLDGGGPPFRLKGHDGMITSAQFTSDERWLYTASTDGSIRKWDMREVPFTTEPSVVRPGATARMIPDPSWRVDSLSADDLTGGLDPDTLSALRKKGHSLVTANLHAGWALTGSHKMWFSRPAKTWFDTPAPPYHLLRRRSRWEIDEKTPLDVPGPITCAAVDDLGKLLATGYSDGNVLLFDIGSGKARAIPGALRGNGSALRSVAVSSRKGLVAAGTVNATVLIWSTSPPQDPRPGHSFKLMEKLPANQAIERIVISPDGDWVLATTYCSTLMIRAQDGGFQRMIQLSAMRIPRGYDNMEKREWCFLFSHDERLMFTGGESGMVRVWYLGDPRAFDAPVLLRPDPYPDISGTRSAAVDVIAINPDSTELVTVSRGGPRRLWTVKARELARRGRQVAGRPLSDEERKIVDSP